MIDTREAILARLLVVVATIPNIRSVHRNNIDVPEDQLPAVAVFDGDEDTGEAQNRSSSSPVLVEMTPEVVIYESSPGQIGSELSVMRRELIRLVLFDTELNNLVAKSTPRGEAAIHYGGCLTTLGWMRSLHGALMARFMFKYTLKPDEL